MSVITLFYLYQLAGAVSITTMVIAIGALVLGYWVAQGVSPPKADNVINFILLPIFIISVVIFIVLPSNTTMASMVQNKLCHTPNALVDYPHIVKALQKDMNDGKAEDLCT